MLWLSILSLIPFDIFSIDSSRKVGDSSNSSKLVSEIFDVCQSYLSDSGPARDASTVCLSSLLTRPDMDRGLLAEFMNRACSFIESWASKGDIEAGELTSDYFQLVGYLNCIALVFKKGHRENVLNSAKQILAMCLLLTEQTNQTVVRKFCTKIFQRIGMAYLPPRVASWRYQRGHRSLQLNLAETPSSGGHVDIDNPSTASRSSREEDVDVVPEMEEIIQQMLTSLKDKDTIVRWSAAKGLGRICMRLPQTYADEVVEAILSHFSDADDDGAWHGGCLALAELSRRGLLLPERLETVVPLVQTAVQFDVLRGQHSVGSHVRDAACYVCWAFARAYSPEIMKPFIDDLSSAMLLTALFDREINCRRAASAAYQENVGRQGNENFRFGIEIITLADYFSLGNRFNAFVKVAPSVAALNSACLSHFVAHLSRCKAFHWDEDIRALAAQGLASLVYLDPDLGLDTLNYLIPLCTSSVFTKRHGSVVAVSAVVLALSGTSAVLSGPLIHGIVDIVPALDKARLFRGRGGELLRLASCVLIENISRANLELSTKFQVLLVEHLNENLRQPHENIQKASVKALRCFLFAYFPIKTSPTQRLQDLTVCKYAEGLRTEQNAAATRGYALALGSLPPKLLLLPEGRFTFVLSSLEDVARRDRLIGGEPDIETRRNAIESIIELVEKLRPFIGKEVGFSVYSRVFTFLFDACGDYSVDKRGDTGSWCRKLAVMGMERLIYSAYTPVRAAKSPIFSEILISTNDSSSNIGCQVYTAYGVGVVTKAGDKYVEIDYPPQSLGEQLQGSAFDHDHEKQVHSSAVFALCDPGIEEQRETIVLHISETAADTCSDPAAYSSKTFISYMLDNTFVSRVLSMILKQMAEKLDSVREVAGEILHRLICSKDPMVSSIVERELFDAALNHNYAFKSLDISFSWSNPAHVFPFLTMLFKSKIYCYSIISGWVIAMGGLTEAVVKESSIALIEYCRVAVKSDVEFISTLTSFFLQLLKENSSNDRVKIPLLKTFELLLRSGCFSFYLQGNDLIVADFLHLLRDDVSASSDVVKLRLCVDVLLLIFDLTDCFDHKVFIIKQIVVLVGHRYPRIRKYSAEQLYLQCISSRLDFLMSNNIELGLTETRIGEDEVRKSVTEILVSTVWDGSITEARVKRGIIYSAFGWVVKSNDEKKKVIKKQKAKEDELDSYESLVREAGY